MIYVLVLANILMVVTFAFSFRTLPPVVPLFYSKPEGELQLGVWWLIIILPLCMNLLYVVNTKLTKKLFSESDFANKIIFYANLAIIIIFTALCIKIVSLVS